MSWNPLEMPIHTTARGRIVKVLPDDPKPIGPTPEQLAQLAKAREATSAMGRKGERNPLAKLTAEKVVSIREAYANGVGKTELARLYAVSPRLIYLVVRRHAWKHV